MLTVEHASDLKHHVGRQLGASKWLTIDQAAISDFAKLTGDDHWIHVDVERAAREMPGGRTIAHGLYLLSLMPRLQREIYAIRQRGRGLNYGYDRVRFVDQVPVDSRVRLALKLDAIEPHAIGTRIVTEAIIEREDAEKPAVVARHLLLIADE